MKSKQALHENCRLQIIQSLRSPYIGTCTVRLEEEHLTIDYVKDGERLLWRCTERTPGHYDCELENKNVESYASLHQFQRGTFWEGYLRIKKGPTVFEGMWRITLPLP